MFREGDGGRDRTDSCKSPSFSQFLSIGVRCCIESRSLGNRKLLDSRDGL